MGPEPFTTLTFSRKILLHINTIARHKNEYKTFIMVTQSHEICSKSLVNIPFVYFCKIAYNVMTQRYNNGSFALDINTK